MKREACEGAGTTVTDTRFGNTICPVCRGIAQVDGDTIDAHTVLVIDCGGDDDDDDTSLAIRPEEVSQMPPR